MSFSQFAGTTVVPTLSRLVLAAAFMTVGYNKLTTTAEFSADQADVLRTLGVTVKPVDAAVADATGATRTIALASFLQDEPPAKDEKAADKSSGDESGRLLLVIS